MKIAVIGAGAIGGLVAGYLKLKGEDISLIGRRDSVEAIKRDGLDISGPRGQFNIKIDVYDKLGATPELAILATKTQDIEVALRDNDKFLKAVTVLTTQNGVRADDIVSKYISKENIISSIVMFGATCLKPGNVVHNFEGSWIIGRFFEKSDAGIAGINNALDKAFATVVSVDIRGMKYLKIFVNANNCIPAILGVSMQEAFSDEDISKISIAIWKEGLNIVKSSGISLASLPDFPLDRLIQLTSLPTQEAGKIFSGIMAKLSREPLYGSILQSIKRGRPSEIDYINGEFVSLAEAHNQKAPLNEKLVDMVHEVEKTEKFFTKQVLLEATKRMVN